MNSLVELQVNSDNHGVMPIVGPMNFLRNWRNLINRLRDRPPTESSPLIEVPTTESSPFQDYFEAFSSRETVENNIRDPKNFNNQMVELRRVYNDAIRQLQAGITGQQQLSTQRYSSIHKMRMMVAHALIYLNRLYHESDFAFLGKFRLMVIVFNLNLYLINRVYIALEVQAIIYYILELYKIDPNKSNLDVEKHVSEVRCWVSKALSQQGGAK